MVYMVNSWKSYHTCRGREHNAQKVMTKREMVRKRNYSTRAGELKGVTVSLPTLEEGSLHEVYEDLEADHVFVILSEAVNLDIKSSSWNLFG